MPRPDDDPSDGDVYIYLVMAAFWHDLFRPREHPIQPTTSVHASSASSTSSPPTLAANAKPSSTSVGQRGMSAISELMSGGKEVKYPEKLLKRLGERIGDVAMARDPAYLDKQFRATMASFYGKFGEKNFQRSLKDSRKIENLILHFATQAHAHLLATRSTAAVPPGQEWRTQLDWQVAQFVHIVRDTVATMRLGPRDLIGSSNKELLLNRLDTYIAKLEEPPAEPKVRSGGPASGSASDAGTTSASPSGAVPLSVLTMPVTQLIEQSPVYRAIARLMDVSESQLRLDLDSVRTECTDAAALADLKHASTNVNLGDVWPGRRTDFGNDEAYRAWKTKELDYLSQRIADLCINNPELLKKRGDDDAGGGGGDNANTGDASHAADFVFIPQHPVRVYHRALELCLDADLEMIASSADDSGVETTILTPSHTELLSYAAEVWRIRPPFTRLAHLSIVLDRWNQQDGLISIPVDCVAAVASRVEQAMDDQPVDQWMTREQETLHTTFHRVLQIMLDEITQLLQDLRHTDPEEIYQWASFAETIYHHDLGADRESTALLDARIDDLRDLIQIQAIQEYTAVSTDVLAQADPEPGKGDDVVLLHQLYTWLTKRTKKLSKQFKDPILGPRLDIPTLVLEKQIPLFWADLHQHQVRVVDQALQDQGGIPFDEIFDLYNDLGELRKIFSVFCPDSKWEFNMVHWFQPHMEHWLLRTSEKTSEWVDNAVRVDTFEPIESLDAYHSSSIDDLFTALHQPLDFIDSLHWPDRYTLALFRTSLAKTVSQAVEQYCHRMEDMFKTEIYSSSMAASTSTSTSTGPIDNPMMAAWIDRAKQTLRGEEKVEPFDLQPASCVKLNNIQKARQLLDSLYTRIDADTQARIIEQHSSALTEEGEEDELPVPSRLTANKPKQFLFTVKVVQAEGLLSATGASTSRMDTYVELSDEGRRKELGQTRTMCETSDPQWSEAFDVVVDQQAMWLSLVVWERKAGGARSACGRTQIKLDPSVFKDLQSHDIWLELDTQGKLLLRISVEAERDDILWYFGRGFRSLKRAESEMVRTIVDKISVFVRHCLSRSTVKALIKSSSGSSLVSSTAQLNLGRSMNMFKDMAASAWAATTSTASDSVIPPVASSTPSHAPSKVKKTELTDAEIENAIAPLLDYLDSVLSTLSENLSPEERTTVLTKVWKQVLITLQNILLPPLSDEVSDMKQLSHEEVMVVMKWRTFLRNYFLARDDDTNEFNGLPPEILHNHRFRELDEYETLHDLTTDQLMLQCAQAMQVSLRQQAGQGKLGRSKSVMNQRSLGTINKRKAQKKQQADFSNEEVIMRLLRMRPGTHEFLSQQLTMKQQLSKMFSETHTPMRSMRRRGGRAGNRIVRPAATPSGPAGAATPYATSNPGPTGRVRSRPLGMAGAPPTTGTPLGAPRAQHSHSSSARSGRVSGSRAPPL